MVTARARLAGSLLLFVALTSACDGGGTGEPDVTPVEEDVVEPGPDAPPAMDVQPSRDVGPAPEAAPPADAPLVPSGCPAPPTITPTATITGFAAAEPVDFVRTVDGDTAHFLAAGSEIVVRFLYVNTEETSGAERTAFGVASAMQVDRMLRPTRIQIRRQLDSRGRPTTDTFGRTLALVFSDGELLETRVIRQGLSAYYTAFGCAPSPVHESLLYAEAEAKANLRGIWAADHPTDYSDVLTRWIGRSTCRPNPYRSPYCR